METAHSPLTHDRQASASDHPQGSTQPPLPELVWSVRRQGRTIAESDPTQPDTTRTLQALQAFKQRPGDIFTVSELDWSDPIPRASWNEHLTRERLGLVAIAFSTENRTEVITPDRSIAWNETFPEALQAFLERGPGARTFEIRIATATTRLVRKGSPPVDADLHRGTSLVPLEPEPDENRPLAIATGIATWMMENLDADGRLPYLWNTSEEQPDRSTDNAIRRFLGAIALGRFAVWRQDDHLLDGYQRHLAHLLDHYLEPRGDHTAVIAERRGANLGASALAGLAILAGPKDDRDERALAMLLRAVHSMHPRRGFRTHFHPPEHEGEGWQFYSGEALLFLAEAARLKLPRAPDPAELFVLYRRCRDRWRQAPHVACVSWHSQALTALYRIRPARELADFVFEMNDWLLELQRTDPDPPDRLGEFGDPLRPAHGTPHVSSTGVYLEGLADARDLARATRDESRTAHYETAIALALRSLHQLQFRDWRCTWYLQRPEAVLGALRSNLHDNRVRIDNCGHALAAVHKLLSPTDLPPPAKADAPDLGSPHARPCSP